MHAQNHTQGWRRPHILERVVAKCDTPLLKLSFMHVPKHGTSFVYSIWASRCLHYTCEVQALLKSGDENSFLRKSLQKQGEAMQQTCQFVHAGTCSPIHFAAHAPWNRAWAGTGIVLLRHPVDRAVSAYLHCGNIHTTSPGCIPSRLWHKSKVHHQPLTLNDVPWSSLHKYLYNRRNFGWATKMLLGIRYSENVMQRVDDVALAKRILQNDFVFFFEVPSPRP